MKILRIITQTVFLCCGVTFLGAMDTLSDASTIAENIGTLAKNRTTVVIQPDGSQTVYLGVTQEQWRNIRAGRAPEDDGTSNSTSEVIAQELLDIPGSAKEQQILDLEEKQYMLEHILTMRLPNTDRRKVHFKIALLKIKIKKLKEQIGQ